MICEFNYLGHTHASGHKMDAIRRRQPQVDRQNAKELYKLGFFHFVI